VDRSDCSVRTLWTSPVRFGDPAEANARTVGNGPCYSPAADSAMRTPSRSRTSPPSLTRSLARIRTQVIACERCPRLREYCSEVARTKRRAYRDDTYWGRPVPGHGDPDAALLVIGLAPAAHGANRTGRMFTGDGPGGSADFLMAAMYRAGFANQPTSSHRRDGLRLRGAYLTAAVRCAPPGNKPLPAEIAACEPYLDAELETLPRVSVVVALGRLAHTSAVSLLERLHCRFATPPRFGHGLRHGTDRGFILLDSYHPSRQNTQTGVLTPDMLLEVFRTARTLIRARSDASGQAGR
jgi:uracil-DNA glycosylase family 4